MNEKETRGFSLSRLVEICGLRPDDMLLDGCLVLRDMHAANDRAAELFRSPTRINALAMAFCTQGRVRISADLIPYEIDERTLYIHFPGSIIRIASETGSSVYAIACEEQFINRIGVDYKLLSNMVLRVREQPLIALEPGERQELVLAMEEIFREREADRQNPFSAEIMRQLLRTLIYRICRIIDRRDGRPATAPPATNRNEEYFKRFMFELSQHYASERSVGFYAGRLHLTPKYLTTIIRRTSGRPAIAWIDDYVILEAKNLLKYSAMSVQEVAYALNFPNQSFFGRYFKNHTGMTPSAYRSGK